MLATVADLMTYLQDFPASQLVMLEAHNGGLIPIRIAQVQPVVLDYFAMHRKMPGLYGKQRMVEFGWGPHCPVSYAREFPRPADVPVLVLAPGNPTEPPEPWRIDPAEVEADMRFFLNDLD